MIGRKARTVVFLSVISLIALPLFGKNKKVSNVFDAAPAQVFDVVYHYAQRHGTIKFADEKRFTLSGLVFVPGGNWDMNKQFDCTISVEPTEGGKKSIVDIVGTFPAKQQSLAGSFGEGPAVKVLRAIRAEFDRVGSTPMAATADAASENSIPDALIRLADSTIEKLRKVDAGFKIDAPADAITTSLIEAQAQFDEFAAYKSSVDTSTIKGYFAGALDAVKKARMTSGQDRTDALAQFRTALAAAVDAEQALKSGATHQ